MRLGSACMLAALLSILSVPAYAADHAPGNAATSPALPEALRGDWFEDNPDGKAACTRFRADPASDGALVGMLRIEAHKFSELAEYGEGNGYVLTALTQSGAHRWQTRSLVSIDGEEPGGPPLTSWFDLADGRLRLAHIEEKPANDPAPETVYARCK